MNQICMWLESIVLLFFVGKIDADWVSPDNSQYHIQTDEGPERFFRYQTDNGQFRNERRLKDGTVIGTEAWIDAAGYLWQKDYIADTQGFRILKNNKIFVGQSRPIKDVISNGRINTKLLESTTPATPIAIRPTSLNRPISNDIDIDFDYPKRKSPAVAVHYNAEPLDRPTKLYVGAVASTTPPPITTYKPFYAKTTTVLPLSSTSSPVSSTTTPTPYYYHNPAIAAPSKYFGPSSYSQGEDSPIIRIKPYKAVPTPIASYAIDQISNELQPPISPSVAFNGASHRNGVAAIGISSTLPTPIAATASPLTSAFGVSRSVVPLGVNRRPIAYYGPKQLTHDYNELDNRPIDRAYLARTPNSFRYYLPKQYHEETINRHGSYGYVDPFGIRRVFYYRIAPNGKLELQKKYRYVGVHGKPYES